MTLHYPVWIASHHYHVWLASLRQERPFSGTAFASVSLSTGSHRHPLSFSD